MSIRGARQVGKSYIVEKFGKENFSKFVLVNFEQYPEFKDCFKTLNPSQICASLELLTNTRIIAGETLIFLDEIQECPQAIMALRYFKEQMPELHLIGAGSLLEFTFDYLINVDEKILPIEVKSGSSGTLRSLKIFMEEKKSALGIRIAEKEFSIEKNLLNLPFYMIEALPRLVRDFISLEKKPFIF